MKPNYPNMMASIEDNDDREATGLVGAVIGNLYVKNRVKPASRWVYLCFEHGTGRTKGLRGYELVHLAREARRNGAPVIMPKTPWRDEDGLA